MIDPRQMQAAYQQNRIGMFAIPAKTLHGSPAMAYSVLSHFFVVNMQMQLSPQGAMMVCTAYHPAFAILKSGDGVPRYQIGVDPAGRMLIQRQSDQTLAESEVKLPGEVPPMTEDNPATVN